jgi:hypothetical protein
MKGNWGSGGMAPRILDLGTRWRWVVSFTSRPLYTQGKSPWYAMDRRLGGPQSRSERGGEEINSQPLLGLEPPTIQPVAQCYTTELSRLPRDEVQKQISRTCTPLCKRYSFLIHVLHWHDHQLTNRITNSTTHSPPWEANSHSASQKFPHLLWNEQVHYDVHEGPPLVPILGHVHPVHTLPLPFP